eukprot:scaffold932_cov139-Skeletonema_menzelii.AAC.2
MHLSPFVRLRNGIYFALVQLSNSFPSSLLVICFPFLQWKGVKCLYFSIYAELLQHFSSHGKQRN